MVAASGRQTQARDKALAQRGGGGGGRGPLMASSEFSVESITKELDQRRQREPNALFEIALAPDMVHLICGGAPEKATLPPSGVEVNFDYWVQKQYKQLERLDALEKSRAVLSQHGEGLGPSRHMGVTIEKSIPGEPSLSFPFVAAHVLHLDHVDAEEGALAAPGSYRQLMVAFALLDFLTASPGSGTGAVSTRSMSMEWQPGAAQFRSLKLSTHFGMRPVDSALHTPVLQAVGAESGAFDELLRTLHACGSQAAAKALDAVEAQLRAARDCLIYAVDAKAKAAEASFHNEDLRATTAASAADGVRDCVATALRDHLEYTDASQLLARLSAALGADVDHTALATVVGSELYESAVSAVLAAVNSAAGDCDASGRKELEQDLSKITVVEIPSCAPRGFARRARARATFDPKQALTGEDLCAVGGGSTAVRGWHQRRVFEWAWRAHVGEGESGPNGDAWAKLKQRIQHDVDVSTHHSSSRIEDWARHAKLKTLEQEREVRKVLAGAAPAWRALASQCGHPAWSQRCEELAGRSQRAGQASLLEGAQEEVARLLRKCDAVLALKVVFPRGALSAGDFIAQLALVECPLLVSIWRAVFPVEVSNTEVPRKILEDIGLNEWWDFVESPKEASRFRSVSKLHLSPDAWSKWNGRHLSDSEERHETSAAPNALARSGCASSQPELAIVTTARSHAEDLAAVLAAEGEMEDDASHATMTEVDSSEHPAVEVDSSASPRRGPFVSGKGLGCGRGVISAASQDLPNLLSGSAEGASLHLPKLSEVACAATPTGTSLSVPGSLVVEHMQKAPLEKPRCRKAPGFVDPWQGYRGADLEMLNEGVLNVTDSFPEEDLSSLSLELSGKKFGWLSASRMRKLATNKTGSNASANVCETVDPTGILQGFVGNCWLLAAVSALAEFQAPIFDAFRLHINKHGKQPFEGVDGLYELELYDPRKNFRKTLVKINDKIPCFQESDKYWRPCFASTLGADMWPMLLEKGIAQLLGGYLALNGNRAPLAWAILTGETQYHVLFPLRSPLCGSQTAQGESADACERTEERLFGAGAADPLWGMGEFRGLASCSSEYHVLREPQDALSMESVWERLRCAGIDGKVMTCTFRAFSTHADEALLGDGLLADRAYSILAARQVSDSSQGCSQRARIHRLVQLRNLWGEKREWLGDWTGPWAESSKEWNQYPYVAHQLDYARSRRIADGRFWMPWEEFLLRVSDVALSETSFAELYGPRIGDISCLWSEPLPSRSLQTLSAVATRIGRVGMDFWRNLDVRDPDALQTDLSSWPDDFPSNDLQGALAVKWLSASKLHLLLCSAPDEVCVDTPSEWLRAARESFAATDGIKVCSRIDACVPLVGAGGAWLAAAFLPLARLRWPIEDALARCPTDPNRGTDGPYTLLLFDPERGFQRRPVMINDQVPCFARFGNQPSRLGGWRPYFLGALQSEMWPMLLEKGIARLLQGYGALFATSCAPLVWAIVVGETAYGVVFPWHASKLAASDVAVVSKEQADTEWGCGEYDLRASARRRQYGYQYEPRCRNAHSVDWVWERLRVLALERRLLACTFRTRSEDDAAEKEGIMLAEEHDFGFELGDGLDHTLTYTILLVQPVVLKVVAGAVADHASANRSAGGSRRSAVGRSLRFVKLQGPWCARCEWRGRWGRGASEWTTEPVVAAALRAADGAADEGSFWMPWESFVERVREVVFSNVPLLAIKADDMLTKVPASVPPPTDIEYVAAKVQPPLRATIGLASGLASGLAIANGKVAAAANEVLARSRTEQLFLDSLLTAATQEKPLQHPCHQPSKSADTKAQKLFFDASYDMEDLQAFKAALLDTLRSHGVPESSVKDLHLDLEKGSIIVNITGPAAAMEHLRNVDLRALQVNGRRALLSQEELRAAQAQAAHQSPQASQQQQPPQTENAPRSTPASSSSGPSSGAVERGPASMDARGQAAIYQPEYFQPAGPIGEPPSPEWAGVPPRAAAMPFSMPHSAAGRSSGNVCQPALATSATPSGKATLDGSPSQAPTLAAAPPAAAPVLCRCGKPTQNGFNYCSVDCIDGSESAERKSPEAAKVPAAAHLVLCPCGMPTWNGEAGHCSVTCRDGPRRGQHAAAASSAAASPLGLTIACETCGKPTRNTHGFCSTLCKHAAETRASGGERDQSGSARCKCGKPTLNGELGCCSKQCFAAANNKESASARAERDMTGVSEKGRHSASFEGARRVSFHEKRDDEISISFGQFDFQGVNREAFRKELVNQLEQHGAPRALLQRLRKVRLPKQSGYVVLEGESGDLQELRKACKMRDLRVLRAVGNVVLDDDSSSRSASCESSESESEEWQGEPAGAGAQGAARAAAARAARAASSGESGSEERGTLALKASLELRAHTASKHSSDGVKKLLQDALQIKCSILELQMDVSTPMLIKPGVFHITLELSGLRSSGEKIERSDVIQQYNKFLEDFRVSSKLPGQPYNGSQPRLFCEFVLVEARSEVNNRASVVGPHGLGQGGGSRHDAVPPPPPPTAGWHHSASPGGHHPGGQHPGYVARGPVHQPMYHPAPPVFATPITPVRRMSMNTQITLASLSKSDTVPTIEAHLDFLDEKSALNSMAEADFTRMIMDELERLHHVRSKLQFDASSCGGIRKLSQYKKDQVFDAKLPYTANRLTFNIGGQFTPDVPVCWFRDLQVRIPSLVRQGPLSCLHNFLGTNAHMYVCSSLFPSSKAALASTSLVGTNAISRVYARVVAPELPTTPVSADDVNKFLQKDVKTRLVKMLDGLSRRPNDWPSQLPPATNWFNCVTVQLRANVQEKKEWYFEVAILAQHSSNAAIQVLRETLDEYNYTKNTREPRHSRQLPAEGLLMVGAARSDLLNSAGSSGADGDPRRLSGRQSGTAPGTGSGEASEEGPQSALIVGEIHIENAVRHPANHFGGYVGNNTLATLCCHVDIEDERALGAAPWEQYMKRGFNGLRQALLGVKEKARDFDCEFEFDGAHLLPRTGDGAPRYTIDFTLRVSQNRQGISVEDQKSILLDMVHKITCKETHKLLRDEDTVIFNKYKFPSAVRVCADNATVVGTGDHHTLLAQIEFVDELNIVDKEGASWLGEWFSEALHVIVGLKADQFTVLNVRPLDRKLGHVDVRAPLKTAKRYSMMFEIRFTRGHPSQAEVLRVYYGVWLLHAHSLLARWADLLPFFRWCTLESCAEINVSPYLESSIHASTHESPRPEYFVPRLRAHLDLAARDREHPFGQVNDDKHAFDGGADILKEWVLNALQSGVDVHRDRVTITCVRVRRAHLPEICATGAEQPQLEQAEAARKEVEIERPGSRGITGLECCRCNCTSPSRSQVFVKQCRPQDRRRQVPHISESFKGHVGYTVEFEVIPDHALAPAEQFSYLNEAKERLRKLHSLAVIGKAGFLFKHFVLETGVQFTGLEDQHFFPNESPNEGATVFQAMGQRPHITGALQKVHECHLDIMARPGTSRARTEKDVREMFLIAYERHVKYFAKTYYTRAEDGQCLLHGVEGTLLVTESQKNGRNQSVRKQKYGLTNDPLFDLYGGYSAVKISNNPLYTETPLEEPAHLRLVVAGVREKQAHDCTLKECSLARGVDGHQQATLERGSQGYTIDLALLWEPFTRPGGEPPSDDTYNLMHNFAMESLRDLTRSLAVCRWRESAAYISCPCAKFAATPNEFFKTFDFDVGVQVESIEPAGLVECSMCPARISVHMLMEVRGSSHGDPASHPTNVELKTEFREKFGFAMGYPSRQIQNIEIESGQGFQGNICVKFKIATLGHRPAMKEVETIMLRIQAMDHHCRTSSHMWTRNFKHHRPTSVSVHVDQDAKERELEYGTRAWPEYP